jgi:hypothetical protein
VAIEPNTAANQLNLGVTAKMLKKWDTAVNGYVGAIRAANRKLEGGKGSKKLRQIKAEVSRPQVEQNLMTQVNANTWLLSDTFCSCFLDPNHKALQELGMMMYQRCSSPDDQHLVSGVIYR